MQAKLATRFRDAALARSIFLPYLLSRIFLELLNIFSFWRFRPGRGQPSVLCLESGIKGWELIEYKELLASAEEYLGRERVRKVVIDRSRPYLAQVRAALRAHRPTHYVYDSRTGSDGWLAGMWEAFCVAILFQWHGIVPICVLTDLPIRAWRSQTAIVSAKRGLVVSLMSPRDVMPIFPHRRIIGPQPMAFSRRTLRQVAAMDEAAQWRFQDKSLIFAGSLYEPRTSLLNAVKAGLAERGITLEIKGRELGSRRFTDEDYWQRLCQATMVITTANFYPQPGADWPWILHLIYRYVEVPVAGSVLVAQEVPSLRRYLEPDVHYIAYATPEEAIEKISHYWNRPEELERIANAGKQRMRAIVTANMYWVCIDTALRHQSLL
jgi:hypothetical protein